MDDEFRKGFEAGFFAALDYVMPGVNGKKAREMARQAFDKQYPKRKTKDYRTITNWENQLSSLAFSNRGTKSVHPSSVTAPFREYYDGCPPGDHRESTRIDDDSITTVNEVCVVIRDSNGEAVGTQWREKV